MDAAKFKEEMLRQAGVTDTSRETVLYPASHPIPTEFGLEKDFRPTVRYLEEFSKASGKMVLRSMWPKSMEGCWLLKPLARKRLKQ